MMISKKAVKEAAEFEAQDKKRKEAIDTRNDADAFVFQTEKALEEVGSSLDAADKSAVEADLNALKAMVEAHQNAEDMTDDQVAEMKAAKEKLDDRECTESILLRCMSRLSRHRVQVRTWERQVLIWAVQMQEAMQMMM